MAKNKQAINPKSADRVKQLYGMLGITQFQLSAETGISQNTLSRIANGKTALSYNVASQISAIYPDISIRWLMGENDFKNDMEESLFPVIKSIIGKRRAEQAVAAFLQVYGVTIEINSSDSELGKMTVKEFCDLPESKMGGAIISASDVLDSELTFAVKDNHGNVLKYISDAERTRFIDDICDYVNMKFEKLTYGGDKCG